ncbi:MAG: hypothetical protein ACF8GE_01340 [Phycisphaerales bacterium JB043]
MDRLGTNGLKRFFRRRLDGFAVGIAALVLLGCAGTPVLGDVGFLLRPTEETSVEYELLYQTFIGAPTPSLQMRSRVRLNYLPEEGYRADVLSTERFEPFPAPGAWKKITIDPVKPPGGNEPIGVDIVIEHAGAPRVQDVLPPDIPSFGFTMMHQLMLMLYPTDGSLALENLREEGDSIAIPAFTFTWSYGRYIRVQRFFVGDSVLVLEQVDEDSVLVRWKPSSIQVDHLIGFRSDDLRLVAMLEQVEWVLEIDPETGIIENASTIEDVMTAIPVGDAEDGVMPEERLVIPEDGEEYRTDRLVQLTRVKK